MSSTCSSSVDYRMGSCLILLFLSKTRESNLFQQCSLSTCVTTESLAITPEERPEIGRFVSNCGVCNLRSLSQLSVFFSSNSFLDLPRSFVSETEALMSSEFSMSPSILADTWLVMIHLWTFPSEVLYPIITPDPFLSLLMVCSMTWAGSSLLKRPDLQTLKFPCLNSL